jgi:hypothetical protein
MVESNAEVLGTLRLPSEAALVHAMKEVGGVIT